MKKTVTYEATCCRERYKATLEVSGGDAWLRLYDPDPSPGARVAPGDIRPFIAMLKSLLDEAGIPKDS